MTTKKTFLTLCTLIISMSVMNAQQAYEHSTQLDKKTSGPCVSIKVNVNVKDAQKVMENLFKTEGLKGGKSSGAKIVYEAPVLFSPLSSNYILMSICFEQANKNTPVTEVNWFVKKGVDAPFETSKTDPSLIANIKTFLEQKYNTALYDYDIAMKIEAKKKEIEQTNKELENLQKQIDNKTKEITKAEEAIKKAKTDIENAKNAIENQKQVLLRKQEELTQIK